MTPGKKLTKIQETFIIYISLGAQERHLSNNIGHVLPVLPDGDEGFLVLVCGQVNSEQVRPTLTGHSQNIIHSSTFANITELGVLAIVDIVPSME